MTPAGAGGSRLLLGVHLGDGGWQANEVQTQAAQQRGLGGFGRWVERFLFQSRQNEMINRIPRPRCISNFWEWRADGRHERPMTGCFRRFARWRYLRWALALPVLPLALRGVKYRPLGADALLRRSLLIYGGGGVIVPFVGIKAVDMVLSLVGLT